ncbi:MAG: diacylglycerol kinase family protein [Candidatus Kaiserbacteria bacterium]|nr:diacylglycerol kinase family protein [Candidatus Kaiserbacteria bacterium]
MLRVFKNGFRYAFAGLALAWTKGINFKIQTLSAFIVLVGAWRLHFSPVEFMILLLTISLVLAAETFNTALEELCDKFQPTHDPHIKRIKDLSAAAVLITAIGALGVGTVLTISHL